MANNRKHANFHSFVRSYVGTMLWASTDEEGNPLDSDFSYEDLSLETWRQVIQDCRSFFSQTENVYAMDDAPWGKDGSNPYQMGGHDFWLTRNGHGAGFWDGDWPAPYDTTLTTLAKTFGNQDPYAGDDGRIYLM